MKYSPAQDIIRRFFSLQEIPNRLHGIFWPQQNPPRLCTVRRETDKSKSWMEQMLPWRLYSFQDCGSYLIATENPLRLWWTSQSKMQKIAWQFTSIVLEQQVCHTYRHTFRKFTILTLVPSYRNAQASTDDKWLPDDNRTYWCYAGPRRKTH